MYFMEMLVAVEFRKKVGKQYFGSAITEQNFLCCTLKKN